MLTKATRTLVQTVQRTTNLGAALFRHALEELPTTDVAQISAALQVIEKVIDDRREHAREILKERIKSGDVDGWEVREEGSSIHVEIDDLELRLTFAGGNRKVDDGAVLELVEDEGLDADRVFESSTSSIDPDKVREYCEENDVDVERFETTSYSDADEDILDALAASGAVDADAVEECFSTTSTSEKIHCTFEEDPKGFLKEAIEQGTADVTQIESDEK